jgi:rhodanese-related sulfurtransferase
MPDRGFEDLPAVCVVVDVCREELLFEHDGEAVVRRGAAWGAASRRTEYIVAHLMGGLLPGSLISMWLQGGNMNTIRHLMLLVVTVSLISWCCAMVPAAFAGDDLAGQLQAVLAKGPDSKFWQVSAEEVQEMIAAKRTDFVVVDVRPSADEFKEGHVPGAIQIPVQDMFKPESLKKLPKNKKVVLMCGTGQVQNLPVLGLRALGYDAHLMAFGYTAWAKGYRGGQRMQDTIQNAADMSFPIEK